ncbi:amino acid adenylation domain-containing protein [Longispora sp. NPDC051575]|uniref:non-ribosomal peptide synthetase/MFS transporter n=1 Tax=Longispora sp. NPDC051575 TaxID=3154943 RepID=UPI00343FD306
MTDTKSARAALLERRLRQRAATAEGPAPIPTRPAGTAPPLSYQQERVWFMEQFAPGTTSYNIPVPLRLRGPIDLDALRGALAALPARHEALRMRFPADENGQPTVEVADTVDVPLRIVAAADEDEARVVVEAAASETFDLVTGPLLHATLVSLAAEDHILLLSSHHIVGDGWSVDILLRDLTASYHGARAGTGAGLPDLPISYGDFAHWQRATLAGTELDRNLAHWSERLTGVPALELPTDRPRPATQTFDGDWHLFHIPAELAEDVGRLAREHGSTLFMALLAAYQVLLSRYADQDDFAVGSSSAGRGRPELEGVVGMFVNMLPLRAQLAGDPTFVELLDRTRHLVLDAFDHADVPFERLVTALGVPRSVSRSPVFQAMFVLQNYEMGRIDAAGTSDLSFEWNPMDLKATRFDLELHVVEIASGLRCRLVHNTALFGEATVVRMAGHLRALLASVVARPDAPVSTLELLGADERVQVTDGWNATGAAFPDQATLHSLIEATVASAPDAVALTVEGASLTYGELNARANQVAHRLRALGVGPESLVGVCAQRSVELPVALLGVLKAGAAYLPLDPEYPKERLAFMLGDAAAPVVLTQAALRADLPATDALVLDLDDPAEWSGQPDGNPEPLAGPTNAAYVIYTSGSTGRPKGVTNTHRGIVNRLDWMQREYGLTAADSVLQKTPASFDVSVWEFFWPLLAGARLVLARPGGHKDAGYLRELLTAERITTAHFVPSMLAVFLAEDGVEDCRSLRRVLCSGEALPVASAVALTSRLPECALYNLYGPTEAAIDVTSWHCRPDALADLASVPIGAPIQNLSVYVLDAHGRPAPVGVPGELHLGGVGVARGYHRRPALTADRFVPDPFGTNPGSRLYRTGDLARWRHDGTVEFLGRIDGQVKLRGQRIELGEIEAALLDQPGVREAVALVREDSPGDQRLAAYVVGDAVPAELRTALKATLPDYMVPGTVTALDTLPLTPNGKLDRAALPAPQAQRDASAALVEPGTDTERAVWRVWADVLNTETFGVHDDFFDLGGHSLLATQVVARLRKVLDGGRSVGVMDLFAHRTIAELGVFVDGEGEAGPRRLLYELTKPGARTLSYVCLPYGGGSAIVYQPLADALPAGHALWSVAIPGHDVGLSEEGLPFDELVERVTAEILERVQGPLVLYGHCGVGNAITVGVARRLEAAGRELEAVYIGAIFPFARLKGAWGNLRARLEKFRSNRFYTNWLASMGVDTSELDPEQADRIITNMRADGVAAEAYFTELFNHKVDKLRAPIISVVGSEDPVTDYHAERYTEWQFLTDTVALVVLDQAGHFFLKHRADELAEIVSTVHPAVRAGDVRAVEAATKGEDAAWALHDWRHPGDTPPPATVAPSMGRFLSVAVGQLVSSTGSALTAFAVPIWLYTKTGSVAQLGLLWAASLICGVLTLPVAGAIIDRTDRRKIMMAASCTAGAIQLTLALLLWTGQTALWPLYVLLSLGSAAGAFQRIGFQAAVPQLVPKRYLGQATGLAQLSNGFAVLLMPVIAAGLFAAIGLVGILAIDVASYALAVTVLLFVRFPDTMGWRPKERLLTAIAGGLRYSWNHRGFRTMLAYFAIANIFLAPALVLLPPLVLSFGGPAQVAQAVLAEALGAVAGGTLMAVWGGPRSRRMIGVLIGNLGIAAGCLITGLHPSVAVVAVGVFTMAMAMTVSQGIYVTVVQVKVPQRYHGRVFALNQTIAWSTLPIGFAILAPLAVRLFGSAMAPGGALADSVGLVLGTGAGRGIGLTYVVFALVMALITVVAFRMRILRRFDTEVPDALPDDLVGAQERARRLEERTAA